MKRLGQSWIQRRIIEEPSPFGGSLFTPQWRLWPLPWMGYGDGATGLTHTYGTLAEARRHWDDPRKLIKIHTA